MKAWLKGGLYGIIFYVISVISCVIHSLIYDTNVRGFEDLISYPLLFGLPIFFVMAIFSYRIIKSDRQDLKWRTPLRNFTSLGILAVITWGILTALLVISCGIMGCYGPDSGMGAFLIIGLTIIYFIISLILITLFSWLVYFLSEKGSIIFLISIIVLGFITSFIILWSNN